MYTYKYVSSKLKSFFVESNHREIIDEHAKEGWRFVGAIPTEKGAYGQITCVDLVFEKKK